MLVKIAAKVFFWLRTNYVWVMNIFFKNLLDYYFTQHAHIYSFHTSNFNFGDFFLFFFINSAPSEEDIDNDEEDNGADNDGSVAEPSLSYNDNNADADPDDPVSSKDKDKDTEFTNNAIGAGTGQLRRVFECNGSHFLLFLNPLCQMCSILIHFIVLDLLIFLCDSQIA
jgi:hypothetical protein